MKVLFVCKKIMKSKEKTYISLCFSYIILLSVNVCFADISFDDMNFLVDDEMSASVEKTPDFISVEVPRSDDGGVLGLIKDDFWLYAVVICGLIILWILNSYLKRVKKLSEQAQLAKDLAEKHFYNIQKAQFVHSKTNERDKHKIAPPDVEADLKLLLSRKELDGVVVEEINKIIEKFHDGGKIAVETYITELQPGTQKPEFKNDDFKDKIIYNFKGDEQAFERTIKDKNVSKTSIMTDTDSDNKYELDALESILTDEDEDSNDEALEEVLESGKIERDNSNAKNTEDLNLLDLEDKESAFLAGEEGDRGKYDLVDHRDEGLNRIETTENAADSKNIAGKDEDFLEELFDEGVGDENTGLSEDLIGKSDESEELLNEDLFGLEDDTGATESKGDSDESLKGGDDFLEGLLEDDGGGDAILSEGTGSKTENSEYFFGLEEEIEITESKGDSGVGNEGDDDLFDDLLEDDEEVVEAALSEDTISKEYSEKLLEEDLFGLEDDTEVTESNGDSDESLKGEDDLLKGLLEDDGGGGDAILSEEDTVSKKEADEDLFELEEEVETTESKGESVEELEGEEDILDGLLENDGSDEDMILTEEHPEELQPEDQKPEDVILEVDDMLIEDEGNESSIEDISEFEELIPEDGSEDELVLEEEPLTEAQDETSQEFEEVLVEDDMSVTEDSKDSVKVKEDKPDIEKLIPHEGKHMPIAAVYSDAILKEILLTTKKYTKEDISSIKDIINKESSKHNLAKLLKAKRTTLRKKKSTV